MQNVLKIIGRIGLVLTILPAILYLTDMIDLGTVKWVMVAGTVMWLGSAPMVQKLNKAKAS